MKRTLALLLAWATLFPATFVAQQTQLPPSQTPAARPQDDTEDVVRISSELVQTDAVVTDKNDRIISDLKLADFEVYDNGKRQELKFIEFVGSDSKRRTEGQRPAGMRPTELANVPADVPHDLSAGELKRVFGFVVDDLTIPYEDMVTVRSVLTDFVDNQMKPGDLVSIVRTVGGKGLLQQFTSDKQLLHQAIRALNVTTNAFSAFNNPPQAGLKPGDHPQAASQQAEIAGETFSAPESDFFTASSRSGTSNEKDSTSTIRALMSLTTANYLVDGLRQLPGRKNLVLFSGGIPVYEVDPRGTFSSNISYLLRQLTDNAARAGVAISTLDVQGLEVGSAAPRFTDTPARSALDVSPPPGFGRQPDPNFNSGGFGQFEGQTGLRALANETGGVSILNTNNFKAGLDKVVSRGSSYYLLAYTPSEKFDSKFHKVQIKVKRDGVRLYTRSGYYAREDKRAARAHTKEQTIADAARSPLARRDIDVSANVTLKPLAASKTEVGINLLIDAHKLNFTQSPEGKQQTSFDIAGFIVDEVGKTRGGFSETVNTNLLPESYQQALTTGLTYSANTELPVGYYQLRVVVREASTGALGTLSRYLETPDISKGRLTMSSLFLYAVSQPGAPNPQVEPLLALRQITHQQDLRYAALVFNPKLSSGKPQLRSQMILSRDGKVVYREPEQAFVSPNESSPIAKVGQFGLPKMRAGRYLLTLIITDTLADKKAQTVARSIDFAVVD